jgi:hypothetical protein
MWRGGVKLACSSTHELIVMPKRPSLLHMRRLQHVRATTSGSAAHRGSPKTCHSGSGGSSLAALLLVPRQQVMVEYPRRRLPAQPVVGNGRVEPLEAGGTPQVAGAVVAVAVGPAHRPHDRLAFVRTLAEGLPKSVDFAFLSWQAVD